MSFAPKRLVTMAAAFVLSLALLLLSFPGASAGACRVAHGAPGGCLPLAAPVLQSPEDGSSTQDRMPSFAWTPVAGAEKYRIRLVEADSGREVLSKVALVPAYTLPTPLPPATYFWRVRGLNDCGAGDWAFRRSLTILQAPPDAPQLVRPADGDLVCQMLPTLDWKRVKGATGYRIQVDNDRSFSSPVIYAATEGTAYKPLHSLPLGSYYWRVLASNSAGDSDWSSVWRFVQGRCIYLPLVEPGAQ